MPIHPILGVKNSLFTTTEIYCLSTQNEKMGQTIQDKNLTSQTW